MKDRIEFLKAGFREDKIKEQLQNKANAKEKKLKKENERKQRAVQKKLKDILAF